MIEVVICCAMVGDVRENHCVLQDGEDRVHAWLTVGVVSPVAKHRPDDTEEVDEDQNLFVEQ